MKKINVKSFAKFDDLKLEKNDEFSVVGGSKGPTAFIQSTGGGCDSNSCSDVEGGPWNCQCVEEIGTR